MLPQLVHFVDIPVQAVGRDEEGLGDLAQVCLVFLHMCAGAQAAGAQLGSRVKGAEI